MEDEFDQLIIELIDEYMEKEIIEMANPLFHEKMVNDISSVLYETFPEGIMDFTDIENIETMVRNVSYTYFRIHHPPSRSNYYDLVYKPHGHELYDIWEYGQEMVDASNHIIVKEDHISTLKAKYQPEQRTKEWIEYRYGLLSASIISKIFCSDAQMNSIIYEKCRPLISSSENGYIGGSRQWGVKYEPVSIQIYEHKHHTKIEALGCIQHEVYPFIGASPDGINIDIDSDKYGTLIEVKNIVNRDITGIPSKEYWIQMQIQMETCNLDRCDFIETRFKEYGSLDEYLNASIDYKGIILHFYHTLENTYQYIYSPLNIDEKETISSWIYEQQGVHSTHELIHTYYWYLDEYSCILVERNRAWFRVAVEKIEMCWKQIEQVRINGEYDKYAPKQRVNKGMCVIKM
jgi:hypothetical protein